MFASEDEKKEIEERFYQFLRMFRSITDNLELRNMGKNNSKILTLQSEIQPLDNSTDVFMMIVFTFYRIRSRGNVLSILRMADSVHDDTGFASSEHELQNILDGIEDSCELVINRMGDELRITSDEVSSEPMNLLIDFKVHIETIRYELESKEISTD